MSVLQTTISAIASQYMINNYDKDYWLQITRDEKLLQYEPMWLFIYQILEMKRIANRSIDSERAQVSSRVEPLLNAVEFIEQDIKILQNNVTHLSESNNLLLNEANVFTIKMQLLHLQYNLTQSKVGFVCECETRLRERKQRFVLTDLDHNKKPISEVEFESASKRQLKDMSSKLVTYTHISHSDQYSESVTREGLWNKIESLFQTVPPPELFLSLVQLSHEAQAQVNQLINHHDLLKEINGLNYHVHDGILKDAVNETTLLKSLENHICEAELSYVEISQKCVLSKIEANNDHQSLRSSLQIWMDLFNTLKLPQCHKLLVDRYVKLDRQCTAYVSAIDVLSQASKSYSESYKETNELFNVLQMKSNKITELGLDIVSKEKEISLVIKHNSNAKSQIQHQLTELAAYVVKNISLHKHDTFMSQIELYTEDDEMLYINKFKLWENIARCHLRRTSLFDIIGRQSPHCIVFIDLLFLLLKANQSVNQQQSNIHFDVYSNDTKDAIASFNQRTECTQQLSVLMSQKHFPNISKAIADLSTVHSIQSDWWHQPASTLITWKLCEGMTVLQWIDQWLVLTQKLRTS